MVKITGTQTNKHLKYYFTKSWNNTNSLNFGGHSIYKHLMKEIQLKLDIAKKENQNIRLNIPVALIKQEEFNTVGNPKMFENSKIIHKFPNLPTERGLEKENNFNTRAVYDGDGVID